MSANCRDDDDGERIYPARRAAAATLIPKSSLETLTISKNSESVGRGGRGGEIEPVVGGGGETKWRSREKETEERAVGSREDEKRGPRITDGRTERDTRVPDGKGREAKPRVRTRE